MVAVSLKKKNSTNSKGVSDYDITLPYNLSEIKKLQARYNHKPQKVYESDFDNRSGRSYANILLLSTAVMLCQLISG